MRFSRFAKGQRPYKRVKGTMTGLEKRWAAALDARQTDGEVEWYGFECATLKLAGDTRYTPDFMVMLADGTLEFHETKGFMEEAAFVRIKVAADKFPFRFVLIRARSKKDGGGLDVKVIGSEAAAPSRPAGVE